MTMVYMPIAINVCMRSFGIAMKREAADTVCMYADEECKGMEYVYIYDDGDTGFLCAWKGNMLPVRLCRELSDTCTGAGLVG
jgi:hypothetical protein